MQRKAIVLRGVPDSGKTTTIYRVWHELAERSTARKVKDRNFNDLRGSILLLDGVKIGFCSAGDKVDDLTKYLKTCIEHPCEVIVCAAHGLKKGGNGSTANAAQRLLTGASYQITWIDKHSQVLEDARRRDDERTAGEIIREIEKFIREIKG